MAGEKSGQTWKGFYWREVTRCNYPDEQWLRCTGILAEMSHGIAQPTPWTRVLNRAPVNQELPSGFKVPVGSLPCSHQPTTGPSQVSAVRDKWILVTTAWRAHGSQLEALVSRYGE